VDFIGRYGDIFQDVVQVTMSNENSQVDLFSLNEVQKLSVFEQVKAL
jgi:hypothetical protein